MELHKPIEIRSEKVRNIIGQIPPVLLRYGIIIITISLITLGIVASLIPYQQTIETQITINQDSLGKIHYDVKVPNRISTYKVSKLSFKINDNKNKVFPSILKPISMSDTAWIEKGEAFFVVYAEPLVPGQNKIRIESPFTVTGEILFPTISFLQYFMGVY
jgi:hypothetical protein